MKQFNAYTRHGDWIQVRSIAWKSDVGWCVVSDGNPPIYVPLYDVVRLRAGRRKSDFDELFNFFGKQYKEVFNMPSSPNYKRDLKQEYKTQKRRGENGTGSDSDSAKRHRARRQMEKELGKEAIEGKDIDHKKPLSQGGGNNRENLRVSDPGKNRSYSRTKTGAMKKDGK